MGVLFSKWLLSSNDTIAVFVDIFEDLKVFEKEGRQKVKEIINQLCRKKMHQAKIKVE